MQMLTTPRLGDILVSHGVITAEQLAQALEQQISMRQRLGVVLLANEWATEEQITCARAVQMDVAYVAVGTETPDPFVVSLVPFEMARRCLALPLSLEKWETDDVERLRVAMVDPWDVEAIDLIQRETRRRVEPFLAAQTSLLAAIERAYHDQQGTDSDAQMTDMAHAAAVGMDGAVTELTEDVDVSEALHASDQAPVIRFVNTLFAEAIRRRASDIHIEPRKRDFQIRYRVDGHLQLINTVPRTLLAATTSRIKIMGEMDISERRLPLDGRISLKIEGKNIDLRVSTLPTQYGERVVMRVLDRSAACMGLDQLGFSPGNQQAFEGLIKKPHGIILVTGPTGSGKTTTLYAALNALKSPTTNIITCEDPIEYELEGVSQSAVNDKAGLSFARQLRAILRQDPDVVLVGEIRDQETAEIAFRAALTGHLVLSTLHCNEAAGAASRLLDMGVEPFLIASTLIGAVAQRLVRKLCPACKREVTPDADTEALLRGSAIHLPANAPLYEPVGCPQCGKVGTRGRMAVHEIMVVNKRIQRLTMERADTGVLRAAALEAGMVPMVNDGVNKALAGLTTLDDVQRKIGFGAED